MHLGQVRKLHMPGDQSRILLTALDNQKNRTADGNSCSFPVKEAYERTFAVVRRFHEGTLTREELQAAGFGA